MNKDKFIEGIQKRKDIMKEKSEELGRIAKLAKESYKNVTKGISTDESNFILGFVAGYKAKENGKQYTNSRRIF